MKIVFMGTSDFAIPSMAKIIDSQYEIVGVVTQPDRPKGRGKKVMSSPIKDLALEHNYDIFQPARIKDDDSIDMLRNWEADLIVVVSYGQIIPSEILDSPRLGCINVHASLLPHYRGAAPIQRAIMAGDRVSGVTTMFMNEGLDTGDIILQMPVDIDEDMDHGEVESILAQVGADLLIDTIAVLASGSCPRRKQDNHRSSYAAMLTRKDEEIDWNDSAIKIRNRVRALSPKPAAFTSFNGEKFKIFGTRLISDKEIGAAGQVTGLTKDGFQVQTGQGILEIIEIQKEGKKRISCGDFLKGFELAPGDTLGG
ncbi:MAG: methionyl-tRNA formyltransferase [Firmicutes bacterium HGW-Firmicutes-15]|nr:MAG: methionyl-tRNA formyltransferase [Firmicutes bacterium HGW-Firmicutes-15]